MLRVPPNLGCQHAPGHGLLRFGFPAESRRICVSCYQGSGTRRIGPLATYRWLAVCALVQLGGRGLKLQAQGSFND